MLEIFKFIAIFIGGKTYPPLSLYLNLKSLKTDFLTRTALLCT